MWVAERVSPPETPLVARVQRPRGTNHTRAGPRSGVTAAWVVCAVPADGCSVDHVPTRPTPVGNSVERHREEPALWSLPGGGMEHEMSRTRITALTAGGRLAHAG